MITMEMNLKKSFVFLLELGLLHTGLKSLEGMEKSRKEVKHKSSSKEFKQERCLKLLT